LLLDAHLTACPTPCREERGAVFVIAKVGDGRYRTMFFYPSDVAGEQYGTGRPEFDDLAECVTTGLRVHANHDKVCPGVTTGDTAGDLRMPGEEP
jgi:hypothetical protein